ncbi:hypothetical protein OG211_38220 [Streptomyces niveus]|uniref:hypothetical protein n=1 Tax=Streptomyces niveus TaxID=193462 RepID=UPI0038643D28|nr:hypothetical protein OG211_00010 [Streptomyces niveus]WTA63893.1 hypothetical protein OG211_38220 [Streptomyces niveus]
MSSDGLTQAQMAYARQLTAVFKEIPLGLRAFTRRADVPYDPSTVSRFLSGQRFAPASFIDCLVAVAADLDSATSADRQQLNHSRRCVMRESNTPALRLQCVEEDLQDAHLKLDAVREHADVQSYLRAELLDDLTGLEDRLNQLGRDNEEQQLRLVSASDYVRTIEGELRDHEHEHEQTARIIRRLHQELDVLRREVSQLREENSEFKVVPTGVVAGALDVQLGWKAWRGDWRGIVLRAVMMLAACIMLLGLMAFPVLTLAGIETAWLGLAMCGCGVVIGVARILAVPGRPGAVGPPPASPSALPTPDHVFPLGAQPEPLNTLRPQPGRTPALSVAERRSGAAPAFHIEMRQQIRAELHYAAARLKLPKHAEKGEKRTIRWLTEALGEEAFGSVRARFKELDKQIGEILFLTNDRRARRLHGDCAGFKDETRHYAEETFAALRVLVDRHLPPEDEDLPKREA